MKKYIPLVLTIINITVIILLLCLSASLLYFNATTQKELFGHTAVLYQDKADTQAKDASLLIVNTKDEIQKGDRILYYENKIAYMDIVSEITSSNYRLQQTGVSVPIDANVMHGVVRYKSVFWGEFFFSLTTQSGLATAMIVIVGGFILIALSIILVYLLKRKKAQVLSSHEPITSDLIEETEEQPKAKQIEVVEENETVPSKPLSPRPLTQPQSSGRTPLIAARYQNDYRSRPVNIGASRYADRIPLTPSTDDEIPFDEIKIHEFDTVEELFIHYHTGEIELEPLTSQAKEDIPQEVEPVVENFTEKPSVPAPSIDSLLAEIMKQAEKDYINEHKDAEIQKYLS